MNFYVTLTTNCNLRCKYCYEKSCEDFGSDFHGLTIDYSIPSSVTYRTNVLRKFVEQDSSDPVLIFDGGEALTDYYRGRGTYKRVRNNLRSVRERGFQGEIVARMTVAEATEIDM